MDRNPQNDSILQPISVLVLDAIYRSDGDNSGGPSRDPAKPLVFDPTQTEGPKFGALPRMIAARSRCAAVGSFDEIRATVSFQHYGLGAALLKSCARSVSH